MNRPNSDAPAACLEQPSSVEELIALIRMAGADRKVLTFSQPDDRQADDSGVIHVCLRRLNTVVDYPARDMTITVEAGMTVGQLKELLGTEGQQLPVDAESENQTLGALVAGDGSGPRRYGYGTLRDYVIGIEAVDGSGRVFHAGGRVVKNVAGYDLCRLLVGSRGRLAAITRLTLKLKPVAPVTGLSFFGFRRLQDLDAALERLNRSQARPVVLDVVNREAAKGTLLPLLENSGTQQTLSQPGELMDCAAFVVLGVEGTEESCRWQESLLDDELTSLQHWSSHKAGRPASGSSSRMPIEAWCQQVMLRQSVSSSSGWLMRLTTLPSRIVSTMTMLSDVPCGIFGRAGNGVLYLDSATESGLTSRNSDEVASAERQCLGILRQVVDDGIGSVRILKTELDGVTTISSGPPPQLLGSLYRTFDPHSVFAAIREHS